MTVHGYHDLRFESVREAFAELLAAGQTRGAALCGQVGGETVRDLWGGMADKDGQTPWHTDTLLNLFSCTKAFTTVAALQLVEEGKLALDAPVAERWPEFAAAGKADITLRQLLSHRSGVSALRERLAGDALYDWDTMTAAVAACFAEGRSMLWGLRTLRVKETDRIKALETELAKIGVTITSERATSPEGGSSADDEFLVISTPEGGIERNPDVPRVEFDTYDDHRMAMCLALIGLRRPNTYIKNPACVAKTYPGFWRDFARLYGVLKT